MENVELEIKKIYKDYKKAWKKKHPFKKCVLNYKDFRKKVELETQHDVHVGIKTYQFQLLAHTSSQGQTPFTSNVLNLREAQNEHEQKDLAFLIEEMLKRRIKGVTDKNGLREAPLFPKLLYYVCEGLNLKPTDPYYYLTELAAKCMATSMQPDIISEKKNREAKHGQIVPCMGCRSFLQGIWIEKEYPINTKFYWQVIDNSNIQYTGAPGKNFNYKKGFGTYDILPKNLFSESTSPKDVIVINFRGNSGWVKEFKKNDKGEDIVVITEPKVYGRFNAGVVTINIPHAALEARKEINESHNIMNMSFNKEFKKEYKERFFQILKDRLEICHKGLKTRYEAVCNIKAKNAPILWQYGALTRLPEDASIGDWIKAHEPDFTSISLGFIGLYETCQALINESNTTSSGQILSKEILQYMNDLMLDWKRVDNIGYSIYGTPEETLTAAASRSLKKDFGVVEKITDHDYITNSYHVNPAEKINAWDKLKIEGQYLQLSPGGAVSYIEVPDMKKNTKALEDVIQYIYDNIMYAEVNTKIDTCWECGYQGELEMLKSEDGKFVFKCPKCGNTNPDRQRVTRRICGYMGTVNSGNTNFERLSDIYDRVLHLGNV